MDWKFLRSVASALFGLLFLVLPHAADAQEMPREQLTVTGASGSHEFSVEVAANDAHRARGLMFRTEMAAEAGMLFVFDGEGERYFWMKNTPLPLDIIFIAADGRIVHIARSTTPYSEKLVPSRGAAMYVLEINAGLSDSLRITEGDRVTSPSIKD